MESKVKEPTPEERWVGGLEGLKKQYINFLSLVNRDGIQDLIKYLQDTDFFIAPASAKNHNNYKGGLVEHSLLVYMGASKLKHIFLKEDENFSESLILVSLCHDLCKINFYTRVVKSLPRKDAQGNLQLNENKKLIFDIGEGYEINDTFPYGHGEKSVLILQRFVKLTNEEIMAIRWHMGGFDSSANSYEGGLALRKAAETYPLVMLLHMADLASVYLQEP